jgi:uncharacterized membrane protein YhaH (DUF805 family)
MEWYVEVLRKYAVFDGRARRKEYWMYTLITIVIYIAYLVVAGLAFALIGHSDSASTAILLIYAPLVLYGMAVFVPGLAVTVRRLHDTGRSGWWILISFVPFVGSIVLLVFMCLDSEPGPNLHGLNPKGVVGYGQPLPPYPGM